MSKVKKASLSRRHGSSEQEATEGTLEIILHVCQCNIVILDSPCQAISLIMVLIWNVAFISFPSPLLFGSFPSVFYSPIPRTRATHGCINIGITIALDDYWETWAILCTHGLFCDHISGDHSWVFTDTGWHLHIISTARSWTLCTQHNQVEEDINTCLLIKQWNLLLFLFKTIT